jgi:Flp pilus assembly protein TadB
MVLLLVSALLLVADILFAVLAARSLSHANAAERLKNWFRQATQGKRSPAFGNGIHSIGSDGYGARQKDMLNLLERIELIFIEKSNIRHYIPFMNIYILILLVLLIFVSAYRYVYRILGFIPSAAVISGILAMTPLFLLELLARYNAETIRKKLSEYISVLNRWCSVKENIMYAFEKSLDSNIGEPLQTFIRDMVIQVNRGLDPCEALDMLQMKVDDAQFSDFIVNIKLSIRHRGDIKKLLTNLENQFYKIDEEYNRRRISTYRDRVVIYGIMLAVLPVSYFFINMSQKVGSFYLETLNGKLLLTVFTVMYAFGFYLTAGITRFKSR